MEVQSPVLVPRAGMGINGNSLRDQDEHHHHSSLKTTRMEV